MVEKVNQVSHEAKESFTKNQKKDDQTKANELEELAKTMEDRQDVPLGFNSRQYHEEQRRLQKKGRFANQ